MDTVQPHFGMIEFFTGKRRVPFDLVFLTSVRVRMLNGLLSGEVTYSSMPTCNPLVVPALMVTGNCCVFKTPILSVFLPTAMIVASTGASRR